MPCPPTAVDRKINIRAAGVDETNMDAADMQDLLVILGHPQNCHSNIVDTYRAPQTNTIAVALNGRSRKAVSK
jgi:hypothetical protein